MSDRTHTTLRLGAIALLAAACLWPRSSSGRGAATDAAAARAEVPRVEVTVARAAHASPRTLKLDARDSESSGVTN